MRKRRKVTIVIVLLFLTCLVVPLWVKRGTILVHYHLTLAETARKRIAQAKPDDPRQSTYVERYEAHRDALVTHGYFERREFHLVHIAVPSIESRGLWRELQATFPEYPHFTMQGYERGTRDMIVVWDRPENMTEWADIIRAHDMPPSPFLSKSDMLPDTAYTGLVGTWIDQEGSAIYTISEDEGGDLRIKTWESKTWETIIKNVRGRNGTILFDQYHYTPPLEKLETIVSPSGEHPFSGVRCRVALRVDEDNDDLLLQTVSTTHMKDPITGQLRRRGSLFPDAR